MNSPTAITYPGLPASVISDPAWTKESTRASSNLSRVTRRRTNSCFQLAPSVSYTLKARISFTFLPADTQRLGGLPITVS